MWNLAQYFLRYDLICFTTILFCTYQNIEKCTLRYFYDYSRYNWFQLSAVPSLETSENVLQDNVSTRRLIISERCWIRVTRLHYQHIQYRRYVFVSTFTTSLYDLGVRASNQEPVRSNNNYPCLWIIEKDELEPKLWVLTQHHIQWYILTIYMMQQRLNYRR